MPDKDAKGGSKRGGTAASAPVPPSVDRPLPHDLGAERAVLGAILVEPRPCLENALIQFHTEPVFYQPRHQHLFSALVELSRNDQAIDTVTVSHALRQRGTLDEVGGEAFLGELIAGIGTTANFDAWCQVVKNYAILRRLIRTCDDIRGQCLSSDRDADMEEWMDQVERKIMDVRDFSLGVETESFAELIKSGFQYLTELHEKREDRAGLPTYFEEFDKLILGMKRGEMIVIAARPSIGKTALALNIVGNVLKRSDPKAVGFFSLEMSAEQISRRMLCTECGYSEEDFYHNRNIVIPRVSRAATALRKAPLFIDPTPALSSLELMAKARRMHSLHKIELVVIDYLQLMRAERVSANDNRQVEVQKISGDIKAMAKQLKIPVLVLAQLNREAEKTATGKPRLSHLRESGAIEQDADIVAFLHRDRDPQKDMQPEAQDKGLEAQLIVEKNRNGRTGVVDLLFFPRRMLFSCKPRYGDRDMPRAKAAKEESDE
jgi:replicative DNA helicase